MLPSSTNTDFAALGLFDELQDAECVDLFADAFSDAQHLELGDQVLLDVLGEDWWSDTAASPKSATAKTHAGSEHATELQKCSQIAAAPTMHTSLFPSVTSAPVVGHTMSPQSAAPAHAQPSATYQSLIAQIATITPSFNMQFAPDMHTNVMCLAPADTAGASLPPLPTIAGREMCTKARRQLAIARWKEKRKRRIFGETHKFPEYDCRRKVANRRPRVNGRFIREQPVYVSLAELQATTQL